VVAHQIRWFQVDFSTLCQPTAFLMLGDKIPGTDYKLTKFTHKERRVRIARASSKTPPN